VLARQKPAWEPGTRQAYHALTLGFYEGELLRRADPRHRSLGRLFQDEVASPLGLAVYIRLPEWVPNSKLAWLAPPSPVEMLLGFPLRVTMDSMNHRSNIYRALITNPGTAIVLDEQRVYARDFEVPSAAASVPPEGSRAPTASLPREAESWGCARRPSSCWRLRRPLRRAAFTTSACTARCSFPWAS
jgi:hypothetical protein